MASFTDRSPATFTPYVPQKPVEAMVAVGLDREQKYAIGVQRVQQEIDSISALSNSLLRPEAKEYLGSKLNSLVNDINAAGGQDFSQANVYNALLSKANKVGQDQALNIELQNSLKVSNKMRQIEALKQSDPKLYSQFNEEYAMEDINKWLTSGNPVGSTFIDTKPFSPYYDYNKEMQDAIKQFLENPDVQETIDPNTGLVRRIEGKSPLQMKQYLDSVLSEKAKQQMRIEGHVMGNRLSDQSILQLYNSSIDEQIREAKIKNDELQQKCHSSTAKMTESEKLALERDIQSSNQELSSLQAAKTDSNRIASILANKGDFYGELFMNNTITRLAYASAPTSVTYDTNQAIVKQLDRAFDFQLEKYRQANLNARAANENALGWARLQLDSQYKQALLEDRDLDRESRYFKATAQSSAAGGVMGSSYLGMSPNETLIPVAKTNTLTKEEKGDEGYNRFSSEIDSLYRTYGSGKYNLMKQLMTDPVTRKEIATAMGITSDQALSAYVAAPHQGEQDIYSKFMMMNPQVLNSINNYLEAKNKQWMKGEKVSKALDDFFTATRDLKTSIESREGYDRLQRESLKSNLATAGVSPVKASNGSTITVDDMIEYVVKGENQKINQTIAERPLYSAIGNNAPFTPYGANTTIKGMDIDPNVRRNIDLIKKSKAFEEYKNAFNETFGQEGMLSVFNFNLSDKKDKGGRKEFDIYASQISTLWNDDKRSRQISPNEIDPSFVVNRNTGEVTFSYTYKDENNKTITSSGNKVIVPSLKSALAESDKKFIETLFYGGGATPLMYVQGSKPLRVSLISSSGDAKSRYTVNEDGSPAKYFLRDDTGNIFNDTFGGFNSPTEAMNWIQEANQRSIDNAMANYYRKLATDPITAEQFNSLSDLEQSKIMDNFVENLDVRHNLQTLSNNRTLNTVRDLRANLAQEAQNKR